MSPRLPVPRRDTPLLPADGLLDALEQARQRSTPETSVALLRIAAPPEITDPGELRVALLERLRETDHLHALGPGDFGLVIEVSRSDEAVRVAQRLAAADDAQPPVAVGVAVVLDSEPAVRLVARAERAVRLARIGGVHLAPPPDSPLDSPQERVARTYWL